MNARVRSSGFLKRKLSGLLLLDKPKDVSSNHALQSAKRLFVASKAGHTGTLDPMATGLLPICFGEATKFSSSLLGEGKTYDATLKLGYISTTGDAEGDIIEVLGERHGKELTLAEVQIVLKTFTGTITQKPPMYSALKHKGKPLYLYAREGIEVDRQPREIFIHDLRGQAVTRDEIRMVVACSTGTYVRTLGEDIGRALGYGGAYLTALRRTVLGSFSISQAVSLDAIENISMVDRDQYLLPIDQLVRNLCPVRLDAMAAGRLRQGRCVGVYSCAHSLKEDEKVRLYDEENYFIGTGQVSAYGEIMPKRLINLLTPRDN